tara:strand:+ start:2642 stop:3841 length:1200 start_codon:yes stop_codon:yes gene_type:complete
MSQTAKDFLQQTGQGILDALTGRVYLRDWQHAAKTFLPGGQGNAGKVKFTFHTYFSINEQAYSPPTGENYGLLVKSVKLPTFNIDVQEMNQYNRKRLIQSKIKYQPIDITFHDDNASQITALWDAYYRYNYADAWNPTVDPFSGSTAIKNFNRRNIYDPSISGDIEYGYRGDARGQGGADAREVQGEKVPFFNNITIYGMWAGNFIAYTLINPVITTMDHDTYDYADGGGTMQNRMTINYETVVYNSGKIDDEEAGSLVTGFKEDANYDNATSPLEQGGNNPVDIFKDMKGFVDGDLNRDDIQAAYELYKNSDNIVDSAKKAIKDAAKEAVMNKLFGGGETDTSALFPTDAATPAMINIANQGIVTAANNNKTTVPQSADDGTAIADAVNAGKQTGGLA